MLLQAEKRCCNKERLKEVLHMTCKNCGFEFQEGELFCPECGSSVSAEDPVLEAEAETPKKDEKKISVKDLGIASAVCAIMAAVTHLFGGPVILMMIASAVTGILSNVQAKKQGLERSGFATAGLVATVAVLVMEIVAAVTELLVIGALVLFYVFYFFVFALAAIGGATA
jgi:phage-related holin